MLSISDLANNSDFGPAEFIVFELRRHIEQLLCLLCVRACVAGDDVGVIAVIKRLSMLCHFQAHSESVADEHGYRGFGRNVKI